MGPPMPNDDEFAREKSMIQMGAKRLNVLEKGALQVHLEYIGTVCTSFSIWINFIYLRRI